MNNEEYNKAKNKMNSQSKPSYFIFSENSSFTEFIEPKACPQLDWGSLRSGFENKVKSRIY